MAVTVSWQTSYISRMTNKPSKLGPTDLFLVSDQSLSAGLCTQDYQSPPAAVMICATRVNTQTHTQICVPIDLTGYNISELSFKKNYPQQQFELSQQNMKKLT